MNFKSVTIWHKKGQEYKRLLFDRATAAETRGIKGSAVGEIEENSALVRVYTLYDCGISPGDRLCMGYDEAPSPPEDAYIITAVTGFFNAGAALRHYKIECR